MRLENYQTSAEKDKIEEFKGKNKWLNLLESSIKKD